MNHPNSDPGESKLKPLDSRIALVTGAAKGLGLGIARELAQQGAYVILADRDYDAAVSAASSIRNAGWACEATALDIADSGQVDRVFSELVARHGRLDILVNNAAIGQTVTPVTELTDAEWNRVIGVSLTGTFFCCRAGARIMEKQESGSIVNISSINGLTPAALVASYNAAKAAVLSLTRTMALELASYGVRVNAVCPGPVLTDFNKRVMAERSRTLSVSEDQMIERVRASIPLGRWGEAEDIAPTVAFLCGPGAAWMTGEVIRISGGLAGVSAVPPKRAKC